MLKKHVIKCDRRDSNPGHGLGRPGSYQARLRSHNKISQVKIKNSGPQKITVSITNDKNQGCTIFGSCLIKDVTNKESPKWLKDKIISLGQKPISAIVDITNYVMLDLNRPLHAYDSDKIDKEIK